MGDPIAQAIEAAVARALQEQLPTITSEIIEGVAAKIGTPQEPDRFIPFKEACAMLSLNASTVLRAEASGTMPPRERLGHKSGYRLSTITSILEDATRKAAGPSPAQAAAARNARASHARKRKAAAVAA